MEIIGRIEKKAEAVAKTGAKYLTFTIEGKNYNSFNEEHDKFNVGDIVKINLEQKGKYTNLISMESSVEKVGKAPQNGLNEQNQYVSQHNIMISRVEKPNSYEFGKAGNRFKVYYADTKDLLAQIAELRDCGLYIGDVDFVKQENETY